MARFFPGAMYAALTAAPGFVLGSAFAAQRMWQQPTQELLAALARGAAHFVLLYGIATFTYGALVWWALRLIGQLNLLALVGASVIPVAIYVVWSVVTRGYDPGWFGAVLAFGIPAVVVGVALWWFTVASPRAS